MEARTILHCDLNNYFASVESIKHPEYQNIPMIVGGETEQRHGIVLAKNGLAKKYGIQTGESIYQARVKCPDLVIAEPHYDEYLYYSKIVRQIYAGVTDQIESMGIDECWLDVTASRDLFGSGREIAEKLRRSVKAETGLTISVGVSFNKVFAKLGSDMKKPDAVTEIPYDTFREIVWPLPAFEMLGVGMKTYKKIYYRGCRTIGDIAQMKVEYLESWLGKLGKVLWCTPTDWKIPGFSGKMKRIPSSLSATAPPPYRIWKTRRRCGMCWRSWRRKWGQSSGPTDSVPAVFPYRCGKTT